MLYAIMVVFPKWPLAILCSFVWVVLSLDLHVHVRRMGFISLIIMYLDL